MNQDERNELRDKHHLIEQDLLSGTCRNCGIDSDQHGIYVNEKGQVENWPCVDDDLQRLGTFFIPDSIGYCVICCEMEEENYPCEVIQILNAWEATL